MRRSCINAHWTVEKDLYLFEAGDDTEVGEKG